VRVDATGQTAVVKKSRDRGGDRAVTAGTFMRKVHWRETEIVTTFEKNVTFMKYLVLKMPTDSITYVSLVVVAP
jgi:hypothetical protein